MTSPRLSARAGTIQILAGFLAFTALIGTLLLVSVQRGSERTLLTAQVGGGDSSAESSLPTGTCGNSIREGSEECDGTGQAQCSAGQTCTSCQCSANPAVCGNGAREGTEQCDGTGQAQCSAGQTCSNCSCSVSCGNGTPDSGERCGEPGLLCATGQTCSNCKCSGTICGDGTVEGSEECDGTGQAQCGAGLFCGSCRCSPTCGNGNVEGSEECDGAGQAQCGAGLTCSSCLCACASGPACGNGVIDSGESCGEPGLGQCPNGQTCNPSSCQCGGNTCRDGTPGSGEQCGEPGMPSCPTGQSCGENCQCESCPNTCGNGVREGSEACDGSGQAQCAVGETCSSCSCSAGGTCGNGAREGSEECDGSGQAQCAQGQECLSCACADIACGNGVANSGEGCGEPGLPTCGAGTHCSSSTCLCELGDPNCCNSQGFCPSQLECNMGNCECETPSCCTGQACASGTTCYANCVCDTFCNNGTCESQSGETCSSCPWDCGSCPPPCGDGACTGTENCTTCSQDCGTCPAGCGDGACAAGETCNSCPGDCGACPAACGDGTIDATEQCDDGNATSGDGCSAACQLEFCGDGIIQGSLGEVCDDGNTNDGDGCSEICQSEICGNGTADVGEICGEPGLPECPSQGTCAGCICFAGGGPTCHNGNIEAGEQCGEAGLPQCPTGMRCSNECRCTPTCCTGLPCPAGDQCRQSDCRCLASPACGDGIPNPGEECGEPTLPQCGTGEQCNSSCQCSGTGGQCSAGTSCTDVQQCTVSGGTCTSTCGSPLSEECCCDTGGSTCGNGTVDPGEACEPGVNTCTNCRQCNASTCQCTDPPVCGDGILNSCEPCDGPLGSCPAGQTCSNCQCSGGGGGPACGDGNADPGEECGEPGLTCPPTRQTCTNCLCSGGGGGPACGNGSLEPGEECEAPFFQCLISGETCNIGTCQCAGGGGPVCGNNTVEGNEQCDGAGQAQCAAGQTCTNCLCGGGGGGPLCGNGVVEGGEQCEGSGQAQCAVGETCTGCLCTGGGATCGNGVQNPGESCGEAGFPACAAGQTCVNCQCAGGGAVCGNGTVEGGEECEGAGQAQCAAPQTCNGCQCTAPADCVTDSNCNQAQGQCCRGAVCIQPVCGDSAIDCGEVCDPGTIRRRCEIGGQESAVQCATNADCNGLCLNDGLGSLRCLVGGSFQQACVRDSDCQYPCTSYDDDPQCTPSCTIEQNCCTGQTCPSSTQCNFGSCQCQSICGNGFPDVGETCGEPGIPQCPSGQMCNNCRCNPCGNGTIDAGETCGEPTLPQCSSGQTCNLMTCQCSTNAVCGNDIVEGSEQCDGTGQAQCPSGQQCILVTLIGGTPCQCSGGGSTCGNGTVEGAEQCDGTGQAQCSAGQTCTGCQCAVCGNDIVEGVEQCDGTGQAQCGTGETCRSCQCVRNPICGDGSVQPPEECDPGFTCANGSACTPGFSCSDGSTCTVRCNNGSCSNTCTVPRCLNGQLECGEECEPLFHGECEQNRNNSCDATQNDSQGFNPACFIRYICNIAGFCSDNAGRTCSTDFDCEVPDRCVNVSDDPCCDIACNDLCGNSQCQVDSDCGGGSCCVFGPSGNICSSCSACGNGLRENTEECDDGNNASGDGCTGLCTLEHTCGNGTIEFHEQCDDGGACIAGANIGDPCTPQTVTQDCGLSGICRPEDGDGCSASCAIEECTVIGNPGNMNAYIQSIFNLGPFHPGANDPTFQTPADPRGFFWFDEQFRTRYGLYTPKGPGNEIREIPFIGPVDTIPEDPAYFASLWEGIINVPALGDYEFHFGSRDDAWIIIDGNVIVSYRGIRGTVTDQRGSIILDPGTHTIAIYYMSRSPYQCILDEEVLCSDGTDDDGDGPIDCADIDCADDAACGAACLSPETHIATSGGEVLIRDLREGMIVWTQNAAGERVAAPVLRVGKTAVQQDHEMVRLKLDDGRSLLVSPGHPLGDGRTVGDLAPGDMLDHATVTSALREAYGEAATYDILPAGDTGFYFANGILLGSTLTETKNVPSTPTPTTEDVEEESGFFRSIIRSIGAFFRNIFSDTARLTGQVVPGACSDDIDNDGDTFVDCDDPGCHQDDNASHPTTCDPGDTTEGNNIPRCGNGALEPYGPNGQPGHTMFDDDGNGVIDDASDHGPSSMVNGSDDEFCEDGNTVSGDGCSSTCRPTTQCNDGVDNDDSEDTLVDCFDVGCHTDGLIWNTFSCDPGGNNEMNTPACGNGAIEGAEQCDNGGTCSGNPTSSICSTSDQTQSSCSSQGLGVCLPGRNGCGSNCQLLPQCSDGVDNADPEDTLADTADAGCYSNGNVSTGTYVPSDTSETNTPVCGNGAREGTEQCDDGNTVNGDSCSSTCQFVNQCNDGVDNADPEDTLADAADAGCHSDDNAANPGTYVPADTSEVNTPRCGNGTREFNGADGQPGRASIDDNGDGIIDNIFEQGWGGSDDEWCDDGNTVNGDACNNVCKTICTDLLDNDGDGTVDCGDPGCHTGENLFGSCDFFDNTEAHTPRCGNNFREGTEQCDDGNTTNGDGCSSTCQATTQCDDGVDNTDPEDLVADVADPGCHSDGNARNVGTYVPADNTEAHTPSCGNGLMDQVSEQCDDGNATNGDGCNSTCQLTTQCNDTVDNADPEDTLVDCADPGCHLNGNLLDPCNTNIPNESHTPRCGNGLIDQTSEQCDDGNTTNGDGCSGTCQVTTECSDTVDNADPEDTLVDTADPGCHSDGDAANAGTYVPTDDLETHTPQCGNGAREGSEECDNGSQNSDTQPNACRTNCRNPQCGDSVIDNNEQCDDGNATNGDGCNSTCQSTTQCNDTVDNNDPEDTLSDALDPGCYDNGNILTGTYVASDNDELHTPSCGNGAREGTEQCDDGNTTSGDGCSSTCQSTTQCSDVVDNDSDTFTDSADPGCHTDGNALNTTSYDPNDNDEANATACGNGVREGTEQCDDGNTVNGDGCSSTCQLTTQCSDVVDNDSDTHTDTRDPGCHSDDNAANAGTYVPLDTSEANTPRCGNGAREGTEQCDDGNTTSGDGCNAACIGEENCTNGQDDDADGAIDCLDTECTEHPACDLSCRENDIPSAFYFFFVDPSLRVTPPSACPPPPPPPACGDGIVQAPEQCDDGNTAAGDGCSPLCRNESCGDGFRDANGRDNVAGNADDELCDPSGNLGCATGSSCSSDCKSCIAGPACGNGAIEAQEHCDFSFPPSDQGPIAGSPGTWECSTNDCSLLFTCGNGVEELGEQCEQGEPFCAFACSIDACSVLRQGGTGTGFLSLTYNLPSWRYGMDDAAVQGPGDPRPDPFLWFSSAYLKEVKHERPRLEFPAPFLGANDGLPGDPAHHSHRWLGTVTIPQTGFYAFTWGSRDDAWILIDGVVVDAVRGLQSLVSVRTSNVFLTEGIHRIEIYHVSRQSTVGNEGIFFFRFDIDLPIRPFLPGCGFCGNGLREAGEVCDDGFRNGQGEGICNALCTGFGSAICGNGVRETGEECDDAKHCANGTACGSSVDCADGSLCEPRGGDGCSNVCLHEPRCGDGLVEGSEQCDDGNIASGDGCTGTCALENVCGNGVLQAGEQCDDGGLCNGNGAACTTLNASQRCGAGVLCVPKATDGCSATCQLELVTCGNALIEPNLSEQCDSGGLCTGGTSAGTRCVTPAEAVQCAQNGGDCIAQSGDGDGCDALCRIEMPRVCGDGIRMNPEECDYGTCPNPVNGAICNDDTRPDLCRTNCRFARCGDAVQDSGEQCDTGDDRSDLLPDRCRLNCSVPRCGDIVIDTGEECDQGQMNNDMLPDRCRSDCRNPRCGDGAVDPSRGEQCDDGNTVSTDGCSATCQAEAAVCGNGILDPGEQCDDGNAITSDACTATCTFTLCRDGTVQRPNGSGVLEDCDDNNASNGDACTNVCAFASCGDAMIQVLGADGAAGGGDDEQCDDANTASGDGCSPTCQIEVPANCGDGTLQAAEGEECDDGNVVNTDACTAACRFARCGDGALQTNGRDGVVGGGDDEQCDDGNTAAGDGCSALCVNESTPACGNGLLDPGEQCDDANTSGTDACSAQCIFTVCGDSVIQNPNGVGVAEQCDDANAVDTDACTHFCKNAACGDGALRVGTEECDDGNTSSLDICSATCRITKCGDGTKQAPNGFGQQEGCDDGNAIDTDACTHLCKSAICGDGIVYAGIEQCDDGNLLGGDGCAANCVDERRENQPQGAVCGNRIREEREECDDGNGANGDGCSSACQSETVCGNGIRERTEECDDGNRTANDGCSLRCTLEETCGNGVMNSGEGCDDGNTSSGDGCSASCEREEITEGCGNGILEDDEQCDSGTANSDRVPDACRTDCTLSRCGDDAIDTSEQCDDGNRVNGDGCSASCEREISGVPPGGTPPPGEAPPHGAPSEDPEPEARPLPVYDTFIGNEPMHASVISVLSPAREHPAPRTPATGGATAIFISIGGAGAYALVRRRSARDLCPGWPEGW